MQHLGMQHLTHGNDAAFVDAVDAGKTSTDEALAIFDRLDCVDTDFMLGSWKGEGFPTGHPLDGVLEAYRWHGKRFENPEQVHPLLFASHRGKIRSLNPILMTPALVLLQRSTIPRWRLIPWIFELLLPLLITRRARARLRTTRYRGAESATMIYDSLPIHDVFRRVDQDTVLGIMDLKGVPQPFFFVLRRQRDG